LLSINLIGSHGLCIKKTQLITTGLFDNYRNANNLSGSNKGQRVFIVGIEFVEGNTNLPIIRTWRPLLIISAFTVIINKSEGEIFENFLRFHGPLSSGTDSHV
jgi:hypothetical protein